MGLKPVPVGQLNNYIGRVLKTDPILSNISVVGEISNLKYHSSGHVYFSLKDDSSRVNCFLSWGNLQNISCPLEEGMEVVAAGFISVYERGGYYSLNVRDIEVNGRGQLAAAFEKLKAKLGEEGLFREEHKKELPFFPLKIAVVTSETGAAVRDIIRTIKNKNKVVDILVYPVLVQGPAASGEISSAIDDINVNHKDVDVIITGRGGGSMEELWAFNEEAVARSIYESEIPVISAVGHETDFTISDFIADRRAATPTAAAEMAVPDTGELEAELDRISLEMTSDLGLAIARRKERLEALNPTAFARNLKSRILYEQVNADRLIEAMGDAMNNRLVSARNRVEMLREFIESSNPKAILARGYSVVTDNSGKIIRSTDELSEGLGVNIETGNGTAEAVITGIKKGEEYP
ncbi:MAG: exodeoxyribonuclease VII large subunit [Bacillota bacterium]|nr:exodeoxyribonuclease VII large subunit [Bacillota bacterium]MDO4471549.1 exodeoxyribonuclease VII large subunit [Bacillota bacterium]